MEYPNDLMTEILYTEEDVKKAAERLAKLINRDYANTDLILVCTLKGAVPFFSELMKFITIECEMEFIRASSYIGHTTTSNGNVQITNVMNFDVENKNILIVEDIIDTGSTCKKLTEYFHNLSCNTVEICTLLNKPSRRTCDINPKYIGYDIEDKFIIGYGFDYNEKYRNIPYIGVMNAKYL